jgi:hypothetical protein
MINYETDERINKFNPIHSNILEDIFENFDDDEDDDGDDEDD